MSKITVDETRRLIVLDECFGEAGAENEAVGEFLSRPRAPGPIVIITSRPAVGTQYVSLDGGRSVGDFVKKKG